MTRLSSPPVASKMMHTRLHTVSPPMSLGEAIRFLVHHKLSSAPVVQSTDGREQLVGFLSERDCLVALTQESYFGSPAPIQNVGTVMKQSPVCVTGDTDVFVLASIFTHHGFRQLPVTDDGKLVGIVTRSDVLSAVEKYYSDSNWKSFRERFRPDTHQIVNHRFIVSPSSP